MARTELPPDYPTLGDVRRSDESLRSPNPEDWVPPRPMTPERRARWVESVKADLRDDPVSVGM